MAVDPSQFLRQQVSASQNAQHMRRHGGSGTVDIPGMRPGEPGYRARIETAARDATVNDGGEPMPIETLPLMAPPANPPEVIALPSTSEPAAASPKRRRLTITFGPQPGLVMAALEEAPDWEMVTKRPFKYNLASLREFVPLIEELVPIKDMTGELFDETEKVETPVPTPIRRGRPKKEAQA